MPKLRLVAIAFALAACNLTAAQDATIASTLCSLTAAITATADPTAPAAVGNVFGLVCPEIAPVVTGIAGLKAAGAPTPQCTAWAQLDDSRRFGGDGKARPNQIVCSSLKAEVEAELAKPPAARIGAAKGGRK